mgnify:CR=1 FL=1
MNIIIVGNGKVGYTLAEYLSRQNHDVTIVDKDKNALTRATETLDVLCVRGNGGNVRSLIEAGAEKADVIIAVTANDELNMVCCLAAKQLGTRYSIARIRDPEYTESLTLLQEKLDPLEAESVVRLTVTGSVVSEEYSRRRELYKKYCDRFLSWELQDDELHEEITLDRVREEFAESSFAAKLMEALQGDQTELQMAYELLQECSRE